MQETILVPSPNWFDVSILGAATDGWVVYGGPNKSLVVLEPLSPECEGTIAGDHRVTAHVVPRAHKEKISCVSISPEWPEKRHIITGSPDGIVKEWSITKDGHKCVVKNIHSHETHVQEKEEVVGVGYSTSTQAITVGSFSVITKWELTTNLVKSYTNFMRSFKALCLSCSPHLPLHVAIGTKQGVIFVLDLNDNGKILYKVRGQDDEITQVSWCPQYEVIVKRTLEEARKKSFLTDRLEKIRNEPEDLETSGFKKELPDDSFKQDLETSGINKDLPNDSFKQDLETSGINKDLPNDSFKQDLETSGISKALPNDSFKQDVETSGLEKKLPDDSFEDYVVIPEDDMFDVYKDNELETFGHKKFVPEEILVKKKAEPSKDDFLAECEKLKADILKLKEEDEQSMQSLVNAMEKTNVDTSLKDNAEGPKNGAEVSKNSSDVREIPIDASSHIHKHLLASVGKNGSVRIWSKSGKVISSCSIHPNSKIKSKQPQYCTLCWYKPDSLLLSDGKTQLLECNPLKIDSKNKLSWHTIHSEHRRGVYCIQTNAPRVQNGKTNSTKVQENLANAQGNSENSQTDSTISQVDSTSSQVDSTNSQVDSTNSQVDSTSSQVDSTNSQVDSISQVESTNPSGWCVWTTAQDRYLVKYSMEEKKVLAKFASCGGYLYEIKACPYDAGKIAISVGDGAVRVWDTEPTEDDTKLLPGSVSCYWQHVQGKVLACTWHPTRENLLAFSTAESRVGLIDTSNKCVERPAKVLQPCVTGGVYSICWAQDMALLACGAGDVLMYNASKPDAAPTKIPVIVEGQKWSITTATYTPYGVVVGSNAGGIAVLEPTGNVCTAIFVYTKMIHMIDMHPQQTTNCDGDSQYKNLLAVCAMDKEFNIAVLQLCDKEGGGKQLKSFNTLSGHKGLVHQVYWSPHNEGQLLSTSRDTTVRIWDAISGTCQSIFPGHDGGVIGAAWLPSSCSVVSGGSDCCLRLWQPSHYVAQHYQEVKYEKRPKKRVNKKPQKEEVIEIKQTENEHYSDDNDAENVAGNAVYKLKKPKKFLLPKIANQIHTKNLDGVRIMIHNYIEKNKGIQNIQELIHEDVPQGYDASFLKIFGSINDVNEVLDKEGEYHTEWSNTEAYMMLLIFRGHMDSVLQFANERNLIDTFLLSLMPCVSLKFWKDAIQLYIAQMDRLAAKGEQDKLTENKSYGGVTFRKAATLLATHDVMAALDALKAASMYKEAYILCRIRHMDSVAQDTLRKWSLDAISAGNLVLSAIINLALGEVAKAATTLRKSNHKECLSLAAELAKAAGLSTFADFMEIKAAEKDSTEELLQELPSKIELLMKENKTQIKTELNGNGDKETTPSEE